MASISDKESDIIEREESVVQKLLDRREFGVGVAIVGLIVLGGVVNPEVFFTTDNFIGLLRNTATVTIIGYGMSMLMTSGEFDLSVGSLSAVAAGIVAVMIGSGFSPLFAIFVALSVAFIFGLTQGVIITKVGLPSLIITIGSLTLLRGVHFIITGNQSRGITAGADLGPLSILGGVFPLPGTALEFPMQIAWLFVIGVILHYVLFHTSFGYHTRFTGANRKSAKYMKIPVDEVKILNFGLVAFLAAFAGIGQAVWAGSVSPGTASGLELIVIAAVVIGGTDLFGGEGTIIGVVLGSLVFSFTQNILVLAGLGAQLFSVFTGVFIIGAVFIERIATASFREILFEDYLQQAKTIALSPRSFFYERKATFGSGSQTDTLETDGPILFLFLNWFVASLLAIGVVNLGSFFSPLDFELFIARPGVGSLVTIPLILFFVTSFTFLATLLGVSIGSKFTGHSLGMLEATPITAYSFLPAVLLFIPFALVGFSILVPIIAIGGLLVALPTIALLSMGMTGALAADRTESMTIVGTTCVVLAIVATFVLLSV